MAASPQFLLANDNLLGGKNMILQFHVVLIQAYCHPWMQCLPQVEPLCLLEP